jgi:DNA invertase Pin-like site-specific DNA recombinase
MAEAHTPEAIPERWRAAQYVRMSTEHQQYSTENQRDKIIEYAEKRHIDIVRTYADEGKSGLRIDGRAALQQLIRDVESGPVDFQIILVYDVSRWGRFQDADESAYYEYLCRRAGIQVAYCAEQFENDGSPVSTIVKGVKRAMAGEYSRELSAKVFAGQCRLIELGYRQGGPAGYGLRRVLVDQHGAVKGELTRGEQKSLQTDRVILMPGPEDEVRVVNDIYRSFVEQGLTEKAIAERLNNRGLTTDLGRPWTRGTVHEVLTNEKYIGHNVYNRVSFKLKKRRVKNTRDMWICKENAFAAIIPQDVYYMAQGILCARARRYTNEVLLERLKALYQRRGLLSGLIINETEDMPQASVYSHRFGSLLRAYELVGFAPERDYRYLEVNKLIRRLHPTVLAETEAAIIALGGQVDRDPGTDLLTC